MVRHFGDPFSERNFEDRSTRPASPRRSNLNLRPVSPSVAPADYFTNFPAGSSPQDVGKRLAEHFVTSPHQGGKTIFYGECATWYGALSVAQLTHDDSLRQRLIDKFVPLMPGGAEAGLIPVRRHVDDSIFGIIPLEIAIQTGDKTYLSYGQWWADRQWENPQPIGLSAETRYWIDDMYMLTILQLEAFRATGDRKYLDRDALEMVSYLDKLQQPNGLFYHAPDVPFFWGVAMDGWPRAWRRCCAACRRSSPAGAHPQGLPGDDGRAAQVPGERRNVAAAYRSRRSLA